MVENIFLLYHVECMQWRYKGIILIIEMQINYEELGILLENKTIFKFIM